MKRCPRCERSYDDTLRFCREDGSPLVVDSDSVATVMLGSQAAAGARPEPAKRSAKPRKRGAPRSKIFNSLAVLPFENTGQDPNMEYLSEGITESIINNLSQLPGLRVMARSTVFRYKNRKIDPQEVGRELGVRAVLTGRIFQSDQTLAISVELVNVADGSQLWGEHYDQRVLDNPAVPDEIASEISGKLRLRLTSTQKKRLSKSHTENVDAYHAYLKGRYYWNKRTTEWIKKGIECFQQAIDIDPAYASAYAGLSDCYTLLVVREELPPDEGFSKAKAAAVMALKIDNRLGEAHASLGHSMLHDWQWKEAEQEFKRAAELNPGYASLHHWYSEYFLVMGRMQEAVAEVMRAQELDPLSVIISAHLADVLYHAHRFDEAIEQSRKTLEMDPNFWLALIDLGQAYEQKEMYGEAIAALQNARELSGESSEREWLLGYVCARAGKIVEAREVLDQLLAGRRGEARHAHDEFTAAVEQPKRHRFPTGGIALIYAALGETDKAFEWLERAYQERSAELLLFTLKSDPKFDSLRSDRRFTDLLRRMNLI